MFVLLLHHVDDVLPIGVPTLREKIPPPRVRKAMQARRMDLQPEPLAAPSNPKPSFQFSWKFPQSLGIVPAWEPRKFPRAAIPFRHPRAFPLPAPNVPNVPAAPIACPL